MPQYFSVFHSRWFGKVTHQLASNTLGTMLETQLLPQGDVDKADHVHDLQPLLQGALASKLFNTTQGKNKVTRTRYISLGCFTGLNTLNRHNSVILFRVHSYLKGACVEVWKTDLLFHPQHDKN